MLPASCDDRPVTRNLTPSAQGVLRVKAGRVSFGPTINKTSTMYRFTLAMIFFGSMLFFSCHKHSDHPASGSCKVTGLQVKGNGFTENYVMGYGSDGKLSTVQYSDGSTSFTRSFTYSGSMIIITITGTSPGIDTVFLNANGDADHIVMHYGVNMFSEYTFTYDGNRQLTSSTAYTAGGGTITATYQYTNGDITQVDEPGGSFSYAYYTDKASSMSDPEVLGQWVQFGVVYQKGRHLTKSSTAGSVTETLTYTFDESGKITGGSQSSGGSDAMTFTYSYDCQ